MQGPPGLALLDLKGRMTKLPPQAVHRVAVDDRCGLKRGERQPNLCGLACLCLGSQDEIERGNMNDGGVAQLGGNVGWRNIRVLPPSRDAETSRPPLPSPDVARPAPSHRPTRPQQPEGFDETGHDLRM